MNYLELLKNGYSSYAKYLWNDITHPSWHSYFYWLIIVSLIFFGLEIAKPWRKNQARFRKDFWLDAFYMFFNFFLFSLIIYNAASDVGVNFLNNIIKSASSFDLQANNPMRDFPLWAILLIGMFVRDFIQWWIHRLLHRSNFLWQFHKVHHSVEEMGFAAQLRYHWMENIVYRSIEYIPLALLGIGLHDFFVIHIFALAWGHYNHANIHNYSKIAGGVLGFLVGIVCVTGYADVSFLVGSSIFIKLGVLSVLTAYGYFVMGSMMSMMFNSPEMHIWHHSYHLPTERRFGVNFGLTLAIWDYIFGTAYIPENGRDIKLGFGGIDHFPSGFVGQNLNGILNSHK